MAAIPTPPTRADRAGGYWWELSMREVEVSRTLVFDDPRRARGFFESLVADNVGVGRPEQVAVVFARQVRNTTKEPFRTRVFDPGTELKLDFSYTHSRASRAPTPTSPPTTRAAIFYTKVHGRILPATRPQVLVAALSRDWSCGRTPRKRAPNGSSTAWLVSLLDRSDVGAGRNGDCALPRGRARSPRDWRRC
jgi:hypothetical protein